jgi:hypothetical protein
MKFDLIGQGLRTKTLNKWAKHGLRFDILKVTRPKSLIAKLMGLRINKSPVFRLKKQCAIRPLADSKPQ